MSVGEFSGEDQILKVQSQIQGMSKNDKKATYNIKITAEGFKLVPRTEPLSTTTAAKNAKTLAELAFKVLQTPHKNINPGLIDEALHLSGADTLIKGQKIHDIAVLAQSLKKYTEKVDQIDSSNPKTARFILQNHRESVVQAIAQAPKELRAGIKHLLDEFKTALAKKNTQIDISARLDALITKCESDPSLQRTVLDLKQAYIQLVSNKFVDVPL